MVGMIVSRRVGQHERRFEAAINFNRSGALRRAHADRLVGATTITLSSYRN